ncbi:MAG TPA: DUF1326 domain-containing protein [Candidatus Binataceae bacterium]
MNNVKWRIAGDEIVSCNCAWGCPCQFNALPTNGRCEGVAAFEVHEGNFGDVRLDGVRFARIYSWPASIPEGNGTRLSIIDDRATTDQRAALIALDSAKHGGLYFEIFASVCPNLLEPIFAPLEIVINRGKRRAQVTIPDVLEARVEPIISPATGRQYRARIVLPDGFEFKRAEMGNTVLFEVKTPAEVAMRHENSYAQLNAFDWNN